MPQKKNKFRENGNKTLNSVLKANKKYADACQTRYCIVLQNKEDSSLNDYIKSQCTLTGKSKNAIIKDMLYKYLALISKDNYELRK